MGTGGMPHCKVSTEPFLDESDEFRSLASQLGIVFAHFGEIVARIMLGPKLGGEIFAKISMFFELLVVVYRMIE